MNGPSAEVVNSRISRIIWSDFFAPFLLCLFIPIWFPIGLVISVVNFTLWYPTSIEIVARYGNGYIPIDDWPGLVRCCARKPALFFTCICGAVLVLCGFGIAATATGMAAFYAFYIYWNCAPAWSRLRYKIRSSGAPESPGIEIDSQKWCADRVLHRFSRADGLGGSLSLGSTAEYETGFYVLECTPDTLVLNIQAGAGLKALGPEHVVGDRMTIRLSFPESNEPWIEAVADGAVYPDVSGHYRDGTLVRPKLLESNSRMTVSRWNGFAFDAQAPVTSE